MAAVRWVISNAETCGCHSSRVGLGRPPRPGWMHAFRIDDWTQLDFFREGMHHPIIGDLFSVGGVCSVLSSTSR